MTRQYLALGGPLDHQWITCADRDDAVIRAGRTTLHVLDHTDPADPREDRYGEFHEFVTYERRRYHAPGWRVLLTFYVEPGYALRTGTVLPGQLYNVPRERCSLLTGGELGWTL